MRRTVSAAALTLAASTAVLAPAHAGTGTPAGQEKDGHYSFAVIGDVPYGDAQIKNFPAWIQQINADPTVSFTVHLGDIKNGSTKCTTDYFRLIKSDVDAFNKPFIYTPGDNEWTDCHRTNNGAYNPLERLATLRSIFFTQPGTTLGKERMTVNSQAAQGFPENVSWRRHGVQMATLHVVGSNDDLAPWTGIGQTQPTPQQVAEEKARMAANIASVKRSFAEARKHHDRAVAFNLQADMFDPTYDVQWSDDSAFQPLVQTLVEESSRFDGQVYLFNGDSHVYNSDKPLAAGSKWLTFYGVTGSANNLTRVTVDGSGNNKDYLRVTVNRPGAANVLSWERVPYTAQ